MVQCARGINYFLVEDEEEEEEEEEEGGQGGKPCTSAVDPGA